MRCGAERSRRGGTLCLIRRNERTVVWRGKAQRDWHEHLYVCLILLPETYDTHLATSAELRPLCFARSSVSPGILTRRTAFERSSSSDLRSTGI